METKLEQIAAKAVKQRPKSVVREIRTPRSVGTGGGRPPPVTRYADRATANVAEIPSGLRLHRAGALCRGLPDRVRRDTFDHSPTCPRIRNFRHDCRLCIVNRKTKGLGSRRFARSTSIITGRS